MQMQKSISLNDLDISGSRILAKNIAEKINQEILRVIYIKGDLGVGKTTLVRFILRELGIRQTVKSPSFSTVEFYNTDKFEIAHLDFFRASNPNFWRNNEIKDIFQDTTYLIFLEWPERATNLPNPDMTIEMFLPKRIDENCRKFTLSTTKCTVALLDLYN
ncbi:MAG: tRNA (adenosine(37)-N6)-threonylcarbamoyltransferase complex ATPase subunit type 1 TsaE [Betaproteobacteria bacterium TMED82]|nr:MAG: tRNA (adenosine(37)-N6)-threonylcarbamoyltransferase complex ATPase subunit type 1 TsaE [Betaproteobacteria bacterium TMED82]|tara:strand:+ start:29015 stop:29497 length:483 start_codon:yes stop_codon:yes gene_type:complete